MQSETKILEATEDICVVYLRLPREGFVERNQVGILGRQGFVSVRSLMDVFLRHIGGFLCCDLYCYLFFLCGM